MSDSQPQEIGTEQASNFQDRSITCVDCSEPFIWTAGEQVFFHDKACRMKPNVASPANRLRMIGWRRSLQRRFPEASSGLK